MEKNNISRRDFLKTMAAAGAAAGLSACAGGSSGNSADGSGISGEMTMRTNPKTGDKVSLLGFGMMRLPFIKGHDGKDIIDQETVNRMVDYAIEHGVTYIDTSPTY